MDIKSLMEAFVQFLTDFFAALGKFLGIDFIDSEISGDDTPSDEQTPEANG